MLTQEFRRAFLNYFKQKGHTVVPSSPTVPFEDPTLLFTNAGMNQFKDVFLGGARDYKRAASSQKCVRVGGKHNDLENVGHTSRHLTFFEMMGNFSFGDYFKKDAIQFAWEVSTEIFKFDPERIWPTVFTTDDEAFELWKKYVPEKRITRFGEKDNFWAMGDTGPCGPCSELYYDRGSKYGTASSLEHDITQERYIEFWNLVFMQFNRAADGKMQPLPKPSIDTGAGLERIVCLKMDVDSLFETDVLRTIIGKIEEVSKIPYNFHDPKAAAFRVIADHLRTLAFAIADGAQPSNVDRGYVLRKILRRAVRYGKQLNFDEPFLAKILPTLLQIMGPDYPEIVKAESRIAELLTIEEEAFLRTLKRGGNLLNQIIERAKTHHGLISGEDAFKLKDTYGLPYDEIVLLAKDGNLQVDEKKYQELEQEAKERSRSVQKVTQQIASESLFEPFVKEKGETGFTGYTEVRSSGKILAILKDGQFVDALEAESQAMILLDKTPFYAEMGGQVGDTGTLSNSQTLFSVRDTKSPFKGLVGHLGTLEKGTIKVGDLITAEVDSERRQKIANNHTATHLLHYALQKVVGEHVKQAGSVVDSERLRFDFNHHKALTSQEIRQIEDLVNKMIRENYPVKTYEIPYEKAKERTDIKQFFGEKYGKEVRVVETGDAKELCGGTHTTASGNIGYFRILKESSIAAGVRRIEAVSGFDAEMFARESEDQIHALAASLKVPPNKLKERFDKLLEDNKVLETNLKKFRQDEIKNISQKLLQEKETIRDSTNIIAEVPLSVEEMRNLAEELILKCPTGLILLASGQDGKANLVLRLSDALVAKGLNAQAMIKDIAPLVEGSGGGKPQSAMAGGKAPEKIPLALLKVKDYLP